MSTCYDLHSKNQRRGVERHRGEATPSVVCRHTEYSCMASARHKTERITALRRSCDRSKASCNILNVPFLRGLVGETTASLLKAREARRTALRQQLWGLQHPRVRVPHPVTLSTIHTRLDD